MPHLKILKALGMTAEEWGKLPPEPGTIGASETSNIRNELKARAAEIINSEQAQIAEAREIRIRRAVAQKVEES